MSPSPKALDSKGLAILNAVSCHSETTYWGCRKQADALERTWWEEHGQLSAAKGQTLESEERSTTWQVSLSLALIYNPEM